MFLLDEISKQSLYISWLQLMKLTHTTLSSKWLRVSLQCRQNSFLKGIVRLSLHAKLLIIPNYQLFVCTTALIFFICWIDKLSYVKCKYFTLTNYDSKINTEFFAHFETLVSIEFLLIYLWGRLVCSNAIIGRTLVEKHLTHKFSREKGIVKNYVLVVKNTHT